MLENIQQFIDSFKTSLGDGSFVKLSLGNYKGREASLEKLFVKPVIIKGEEKLCFVYRYTTKDITKNYTADEGVQIVKTLIRSDSFCFMTLFTTEFDLELSNAQDTTWNLKKRKPTNTEVLSKEHDRQKNRKIEAHGKHYLQELKITDMSGKVLAHAQDKYKQINHYIDILSPLLQELPEREVLSIVDMGAGKGYLTFALYDYVKNICKKNVTVTGVEYRRELVNLCNDIAQKSGFEGLSFVEGSIESYKAEDINVLIALHACDTATDDAIAKGIKSNADLLVVAPCCHKQIRVEMERSKLKNEFEFLTKYGIFLERQSEMITDGLRALILEYFGYSTRVFEFISDAHTPKNVLIVGQKKKGSVENKAEILKKIQETKEFFGIQSHHLEKMMGM